MFLPVASNDNDDLLALNTPFSDLSLVRKIKWQLLSENMANGILLSSRKERRFFQELLDAERYIIMRYFTSGASEDVIRALKQHIVSSYLCPKSKRGRKKLAVKK